MLYVISLGGSLIVPEAIDVRFLKNFRTCIIKNLKKNKFVIIAGGGKTARKYIEAATKIYKIASEDKDWLGIHATRLNAHLLRTIFRDYAHPRIITNPKEKIKFKEKILIAAGWRPGFSTDYDAVLIAKNLGSKRLINITDLDYIYTKDPKQFKDAKPIKRATWDELIKILPKRWSPGLHTPFDPVAARLAKKIGLTLFSIGPSIENLKNLLKAKAFKGTIVA